MVSCVSLTECLLSLDTQRYQTREMTPVSCLAECLLSLDTQSRDDPSAPLCNLHRETNRVSAGHRVVQLQNNQSVFYLHTSTLGDMTLGRCPWSIFCSRGTPPRVYHLRLLVFTKPHQIEKLSPKRFGIKVFYLSHRQAVFSNTRVCVWRATLAHAIHGYLTYKKTHPPRTLP